MDFEEYRQIYETTLLCQTEQSQTFKVERDNLRTVCKRFPSPLERKREEIAYGYLVEQDAIKVPGLLLLGEDFLEFQFIEKTREPEDTEIITELSKLYIKTLDDAPSFLLSRSNLTKEKIFNRISYIKDEFIKSSILEEGILEKAKQFTQKEYDYCPHICVVHGDLKSLHCIPSSKNIYFIDFGLTSIANPWHDIAFLYLEKRDKAGLLERLAKTAHESLKGSLNISEEQSRQYLKSGVFNRSLYYLGFALRHRPKKSIERAKRELNEIMGEKT